MKPLLILRPEPGLSRSMARAKALGLEPAACPLFVIERLCWDAPAAGAFDALLLTSANAVREAGPGIAAYRDLPVHAVGEGTTQAAQAAGLTVASMGKGGIDELLEAIEPRLRLLQLAGAHRVAPGSDRHDLTIVSVYRAAVIEEAELPPLGNIVVAVHSQRAGRRLDAMAANRQGATLVAISEAAAAACGEGWARVAVAERASDEALLALAAELCQVPAQS